MKKITVLWLILDLVFLIIFNIVFFVAGGTHHSSSVWLSYSFILFSYLMLLLTPFLIRKSSSAAVFGFSLITISSIYFFVEFVIGIIFILLSPDSIKAALVIQVIIAGFYIILLISHMIANEYTADSLEEHEQELKYVKECSSKLNALLKQVNDAAQKKKIEKAFDLIQSSPVKSSSSVYDLENAVLNDIDSLETAIRRKDSDKVNTLADTILTNAQERNRLLKLNNH